MSDEKLYSPIEFARIIAGRCQALAKSSNSAHEIDAGEEPNNDDAECPASLSSDGAGSASSEGSEKSEYSEDSGMEDQPLQGESDEDEEKKKKKKPFGEESDEDESDESDESESEEDKFDFKKSESGMFEVEYSRLKKEEKSRNIEFHHSDEGGPSRKQSNSQQAMSGIKRPARLDDQARGKKATRKRLGASRAATAAGTPDMYEKKNRREIEGTAADREKGGTRRETKRVREMKSSESMSKGTMISDEQKRQLGYDKESKKYNDRQKEVKGTKLDTEHPQFGVKEKTSKLKEKTNKLAASEGKKVNDLKNQVKKIKGINLDDKESKSDKTKEEEAGIKRPMEKGDAIEKCYDVDGCECECGDKKSKSVGKLKKFLGKEKQPSPGMVQKPQLQ